MRSDSNAKQMRQRSRQLVTGNSAEFVGSKETAKVFDSTRCNHKAARRNICMASLSGNNNPVCMPCTDSRWWAQAYDNNRHNSNKDTDTQARRHLSTHKGISMTRRAGSLANRLSASGVFPSPASSFSTPVYSHRPLSDVFRIEHRWLPTALQLTVK